MAKINAIYNGVTAQNITSIPIENKDGLTIGIIQLSATDESQSVTYETPTIDVSEGGLITATANGKSGTKQLTTQGGKTVTPTTSVQTSAVPKGVFTTGAIAVDKIPSNYVVPTGSQTLSANGSYNVKNLEEVVVSVPTTNNTVVVSGTANDVIGGVGGTTATPRKIVIDGLKGQPVSFALVRNSAVAVAGTRYILSVCALGNLTYGTCAYETQAYSAASGYGFSTGYTWSYTNGKLTIESDSDTLRGVFKADTGYDLIYTYATP